MNVYTTKQAVEILHELCHLCVPVFGSSLKEGYLYGSYARGDHHEESDVDILLTVDIAPEAIGQYRKAIAGISSDLSLKHDITVSVSVKQKHQFEERANYIPFYQNVRNEGICYAIS